MTHYHPEYKPGCKLANARIAELEAERDAWKEQRDAEQEAWADEFNKRVDLEALLREVWLAYERPDLRAYGVPASLYGKWLTGIRARVKAATPMKETHVSERDMTPRIESDFPCTYCRGMTQHDPTCQLLVIRATADYLARAAARRLRGGAPEVLPVFDGKKP